MTEKIAAAPVTAAVTLRKYGLRLLLAVLIFSVLGFLVLPPLVKGIVVAQLSEILQRPVSIESVTINPYALSLQVDGLAIQETGGSEAAAGFDHLYLNVESSSLFRGGPVVSELRLAGPTVKLVRLPDGRFNVSDLIDRVMAMPPSDDPTPAFSVNNIQITAGKLEFDDQLLGEKHLVSEIDLALPFVSSLPSSLEIFVEPAFSAAIDGAPLTFQGRSKPFAESRESELVLALRQVQLNRYVDYLPLRLPLQVVSGTLDSDLKLLFRRQEEGHSTLVLSGSVALDKLRLKDRAGAPLLSLQRLEVVLGALDPLGKRFVIDRVALDSPEIHARVSPQGTINWIDFFKQELAARGTPVAQATPASPMTWSLGEAKITGGALRWLDESHGKPFNASMEGIDLLLNKLDSAASQPAEFTAAWRLKAEPWLKVDDFSLKGGQLDLARREVRIDEMAARDASLLIRRTADGRIEFVQPPALRVVAAAQKDTAAPWKLTVAKCRGEGLGLRFEDAAISPAVTHTIDELRLDADNLTTEPGQTAKLSTRFRVNGQGEIEAGGSIKAFPFDADLKLVVRTLGLLPLQPYVTEQLNIAVTHGHVTLDGAVRLRESEPAAADPARFKGDFSGQLTVGDFHAIDKNNAADFLKWKSLHLGKIDLRLAPDSLSIGEVALADFFARVIISREGKLNLLQIVHQSEAPPAAPVAGAGKAVVAVAAASQPPLLPVAIGRVTLQGGDVRFSDNFIRPNYSARLRKIGGTISGLSSAAGSVANLELRGSYDNIAPLSLSGQLNPLSATPYLDLQADIKGIEMTSLSPYSAKYAGYAIEKGKLSLFVKYKIENNQLSAENRVFLDQLVFGEAVDSPEATKLPVTLAVALLKNQKGEIDINLPIAGSLGDPQFSIGGLLAKVVVNLLVKAATSPFALLGAVFGGGEELSDIDFEAGRARVTPSAQARLENLARALVDRPALKLDIEGRADPENDPEGLRSERLARKLRGLRREESMRQGEEGDSGESVEVSASEYPVLLERVYRAENFPKPRNVLGLVKSLPASEMEKLILANSTVDEADLRQLAERRAKAVVDWLIAHEVPSERLFRLPARLVAADGRSEAAPGRESRVVLSLK
ncbi:MAG: DUF748 domain-containing protein [Candidatus Accumulibacter sp. UW26]|jgi:hypothetical protein